MTIRILKETLISDDLFYSDYAYLSDDGIDLYPEEEGGTVSYTTEHEEVINTSGDPIITSIDVDGKTIKIISLFPRETYELMVNMHGNWESKDVDGNPIIYALKGIKSWAFASEANRAAFMDRVYEAAQVLDYYGTLLIIPSTNKLNEEIAKLLEQKADTCMIGLLDKRPAKEVYDETDWRGLREAHGAKAVRTLAKAFSRMKYFFEMKEVKNRDEATPFLGNIFQMNSEISMEEFNNLIRDKDLLVIDDTITSGSSITFGVRNLIGFEPKSVTVLTVFSAKNPNYTKEMDDFYDYFDDSVQEWDEIYDDSDYYLED